MKLQCFFYYDGRLCRYYYAVGISYFTVTDMWPVINYLQGNGKTPQMNPLPSDKPAIVHDGVRYEHIENHPDVLGSNGSGVLRTRNVPPPRLQRDTQRPFRNPGMAVGDEDE